MFAVLYWWERSKWVWCERPEELWMIVPMYSLSTLSFYLLGGVSEYPNAKLWGRGIASSRDPFCCVTNSCHRCCRCPSWCRRHRRYDWRCRSLSINPVAISILVPAKPVMYPTHYWHLLPVKCQQKWYLYYRKLQIFIGHHPHNHVNIFGLLTT